jgi:hypothetical protein
VHGNREAAENAGYTGGLQQSGADSGALSAQSRLYDSELQVLIEAWPSLPAEVLGVILAMTKGIRDGVLISNKEDEGAHADA